MILMRRLFYLILFLVFYMKEIFISNMKLAHDILTIKQYYRDGVIKVKVNYLTSVQLALLMNLITMTPGTICLDYNEETQNLIIHVMFMDESEKIIQKIQSKYLPFINEVL